MKKLILSALGMMCFSLSVNAQQTEEPQPPARNTEFSFFAGAGVAIIGDYTINDKLAMAGMPQIGDTSPEVTLGYNLAGKEFSMDLEVNANYFDKKHPDNRVQMGAAGIILRPHYVALKNNRVMLSGGLDLNFIASTFELYRRGMVTDLNNLNPSDYNGRVSLKNSLFYIGPSVKFMFLRNYDIPLSITTGYNIAFTNGKWKSDFGSVANTVNESGHNRFYAKLCYYLN